LDHRDQPDVSVAQAALRLELRNVIVDLTDVVGALRFGDGDAIHVLADGRIEVLDGQLHRAVDAHDDVGAALPDPPGRLWHEPTDGLLLRDRNAVLEIELNAVGAPQMRFLDIPPDVDGDVEQRPPDWQVGFQHARPMASTR